MTERTPEQERFLEANRQERIAEQKLANAIAREGDYGGIRMFALAMVKAIDELTAARNAMIGK